MDETEGLRCTSLQNEPTTDLNREQDRNPQNDESVKILRPTEDGGSEDDYDDVISHEPSPSGPIAKQEEDESMGLTGPENAYDDVASPPATTKETMAKQEPFKRSEHSTYLQPLKRGLEHPGKKKQAFEFDKGAETTYEEISYLQPRTSWSQGKVQRDNDNSDLTCLQALPSNSEQTLYRKPSTSLPTINKIWTKKVLAVVAFAFLFNAVFTTCFVLLHSENKPVSSSLTALVKEMEQLKSKDNVINETIYAQLRVIKSLNKSMESLEKEYDARISEKFKSLLNSEAEERKYQLESVRNEAEKNSKVVEDNRIKLKSLATFDCKNAVQDNAKVWNGTGGVFDILRGRKLYEVYCDMTTDGGGWMVFQRRMDGSTDFYRTWEEYADGFGSRSREFWLGLENIHQLTQDGAYELRVDLSDWDGSTAFARYGKFSISERSDNYRLTVGNYSGTTGDSMADHNNWEFSAKNRDLDGLGGGNCATRRSGAWWYVGCGLSNLNGRYNGTGSEGVYWNGFQLVKTSEIKFRKK